MKVLLKNKYLLLAITAYGLFSLVGVANNIISSTTGSLSIYLTRSVDEIGILISIFNFGRMSTLILGGFLTDKYGSKIVMVTSLLFFLIFLFTIPMTNLYLVVMVVSFIAGAANGLADTSAMTLIFRCFPNNYSVAMLGVQLSFATGAFLTPLIVSYLIYHSINFTLIYWLNFAFASILLGIVILLKFPESQQIEGEKVLDNTDTIFKIKPRPNIEGVILGLNVFTGNAIFILVIAFTIPYLMESREFSEALALQTLALLSFSSVIGCIILSRLLKYFHSTTLIIVNMVVVSFGIIILYLSKSEHLAKLGFIVLGMGVGSLYSLNVSVTGEVFYKNRGIAIGVISTFATFSGVLIPIVFSKITKTYSIDSAYIVLLSILVAIGLLISTLLKLRFDYILKGNIVD
jgi:MFS family permease